MANRSGPASIRRLDESVQQAREAPLLTLDAVVEEKRRRKHEETRVAPPDPVEVTADEQGRGEGEGESESELGQQGAFNEETGEINWDCPCLGGMAHGPCGEEFKAAFSCFVYSKEEPKGMECIENFK